MSEVQLEVREPRRVVLWGRLKDKVSEMECITKTNEFYEKYQSDKLLVYCKCKKKKKKGGEKNL